MNSENHNPYSGPASEAESASGTLTTGKPGVLGWIMALVSFAFVGGGGVIIGVFGIPMLLNAIGLRPQGLLSWGWIILLWWLLTLFGAVKSAVDTLRIHRKKNARSAAKLDESATTST